jgi:hypothetical protein
MSVRSETIRLLLEARGTQAATDLQNRLDLVNGSIKALNDSYSRGDVTLSQYRQGMSSLARESINLGKDMDELRKQTFNVAGALQAANAQLGAMVGNVSRTDVSIANANKQLGAMVGNLNKQDVALFNANKKLQGLNLSNGTYEVKTKAQVKASKNAALGFLAVSQAVEDAQYGIRGILNNIPQAILLFGGSAGLAASVSLAAVALVTLGPRLAKVFTGGTKEAATFDRTLKAVQDRIEELDKKPHKIALDYAVLEAAKDTVEEIKQNLAAYQALKNRKTSLQEQQGSLLSETVVENAGGARNLGNILEQVAKREGTFGSDQRATRGRITQLQGLIKGGEKEVSALQTSGANPIALANAMDALKANKDELVKRQAELQKAGRETIDAFVGALVEGSEDARQTVAEKLKQHPDLFKGKVDQLFGFNLEQASPQAIRDRQKESEFIDNQQRMARLDKALGKQDAKQGRKDDAAKKKEAANAEKLFKAGQRVRMREGLGLISAGHDFITKANQGVKITETAEKKDQRAEQAAINKAAAKLVSESGKDFQLMYEQALSQNRLAIEQGSMDAVAPNQLETGLRQQMFQNFRSRGASPEVAKKAAQDIANKGQGDLSARFSNIANQGMDTTGVLMNIVGSLMDEVDKKGHQENFALRQMEAQQKFQNQQAKAMWKQQQVRKRNNLNRGR